MRVLTLPHRGFRTPKVGSWVKNLGAGKLVSRISGCIQIRAYGVLEGWWLAFL